MANKFKTSIMHPSENVIKSIQNVFLNRSFKAKMRVTFFKSPHVINSIALIETRLSQLRNMLVVAEV